MDCQSRRHHIVWQTGQQDGPELPQPAHHTHCSAFAAAVALYLDIYLLRPPHHGQAQLANAQTHWLSGRGSFPGPSAASRHWVALGVSDDEGALTAGHEAANVGRLVLVCYAETPPMHGHVAILRPRKDGRSTVPADGPKVIMAGAHNHAAVSLHRAFRNHAGAWLDHIALFAHATALQRDPAGKA